MSKQKTSSERIAEVLQRALRRGRRPQVAAEPIEALPPPTPRAFSIAISREAGANGSAIGRRVGEKLGWQVYDYELVERIAGEMGLRSKLLESVDEKRMSWLQECVQAFVSDRTVTQSGYVRRLVETLLTLALRGECVLVGRGANVVAPPETTLRVRLTAPLRDRIETVRARRGLSFEEAQKWVEKTDRERINFVKDHFHREANDVRLYDVVLNTARFSMEECADLIIEALHCMQARSRQAVKLCEAVAAGPAD